MKIRSLGVLPFAVLVALVIPGSAFAATEPASKADAAAPIDTAKAKPVLDKGMNGDTILKFYGKPAAIEPMAVAEKELKVERWIYRRKASESTTQTPVGYTTVAPPMAVSPTSGSAAIYIPVTQIPIYKLKRTTTYQVTELLMVDNKLAVAKQRTERQEAFE